MNGKNQGNAFEAYEGGCWIAIIADIDKAGADLQLREKGPSKLLKGHDFKSSPCYTDYSSLTYIKQGLPIDIFDSSSNDDKAGVFVNMENQAIDYWYDGQHGEFVTDSMERTLGKKLDNGLNGQYWDATREGIDSVMLERYKVMKKKHEEECFDNWLLPWNEGMFRFKRENIVGIRVNVNSNKSKERALAIKKNFEVSVPFYSYDPIKATCIRISDKQLVAVSCSSSEDSSSYNSYSAHFKTRFL